MSGTGEIVREANSIVMLICQSVRGLVQITDTVTVTVGHRVMIRLWLCQLTSSDIESTCQ